MKKTYAPLTILGVVVSAVIIVSVILSIAYQPDRVTTNNHVKYTQQRVMPAKVIWKNPISHFMKIGSKGKEVCILQKILKAEKVLGVKPTCYYGVKTHWAISKLLYKYGYFQTPDNFGTVDKTAKELINKLYVVDNNGIIKRNTTITARNIQNPEHVNTPPKKNTNNLLVNYNPTKHVDLDELYDDLDLNYHYDNRYKYNYRTGYSGNYEYNYDIEGYNDDGDSVYGNIDIEGKYGSGYIYDEYGNEKEIDVEWVDYGELEGYDEDGNYYELEVS